MLVMMRIWFTNRALFRALSVLARAVDDIPGRVSPVDRQWLNVMFWSKYDSGWHR